MNRKISKIFFVIFFLILPTITFAIQLETFTEASAKKIIYGKSGADIKKLQVVLNQLGYDVAEEGPGSIDNETDKFDKNLLDALKEFQKENEIKVTGKFDAETMKVTNELIKFANETSSAFDEEEASTTASTSPDVFSTYSSDISDEYSDSPEMNKDYFTEGNESIFIDESTSNNLSNYVGSALKTYTGIDITGKFANEKADKAKTVLNPIEIKSTGNFFQDIMLKSMLNNASVFIYNTFVESKDQGTVRSIGLPSTAQFSQEEIDESKANIIVDGKFDLIKCLQDPICSKY